jgi:hypothetical protein
VSPQAYFMLKKELELTLLLCKQVVTADQDSDDVGDAVAAIKVA